MPVWVDLNVSQCLGMNVWLELAFILLIKRVFQELFLKKESIDCF